MDARMWENELIKKVNPDYLMDYTTEISKQVRLSGSVEELDAFRYIERTLRGFGLETKLTFSDAYISLPMDSELRVDQISYRCITASMAAPTGEKGIEAQLLYVGDMKGLQELAEQVPGKAVIYHGFAGRAQVQKAEQAGAAACIFINGERLHNMIVSPVWGNPTPDTFSLIPKISVVSVDKYDGEKLIKQAETGAVAHIVTRVDTGWRKIPTLIAEIKGKVEPEKYILFSGHVDSWEYGAMDNASANATMMEVGRILADQPLRRSLRLAFWSGHSHGRYAGSTFYMDTNYRDIDDHCLFHINVDSVGAIGATVVSEGNIMPLTKRLAVKVIAEQTGQTFVGKPFGRSGDQSFWGAGVPSAFMAFSGQPYVSDPVDVDTRYMITQFNNGPLSSGFGWWWHSTEDTIDKIDAQYLQRDAAAYLSYVFHCCNDSLLPLDLEAGLDELKKQLQAYRQKIEGYLSWAPVGHALDGFEQATNEVIAACGREWNEPQLAVLNETVQTIAKTIVRLMQVGHSKFEHDPALPMPPIPLLADIHQLEKYQDDEHQRLMLLTKIQRRLNQTESILHDALENVRINLRKLREQS